ncbi:RNA polymerase sigma factor [Candidatus Peregrinibacteria bacterium]|nr:MAG: RNA polymerase sigma factor [Candidatus Peregrinibacteria bacterium]
MEEEELIEAARKDPEAFGVLFDLYHPKILAYLIHRTGELALAQDLAAETFFKALSKLWQFRWRSVSFSAWLYRIATNELRMHFRGKKKLCSLEAMMENTGFDLKDSADLEEELRLAEEVLERHEEFLRVQKQIQTLPLLYQEVIALRFFEEKSVKEIASILNKREGTVKSLLSRGLEKLRALQPF